MNTGMVFLKYLVALSGVVFALIVLHKVLFYWGVINFEFKRPDRIKKLFEISFWTHMISLVIFLITLITHP